MKRSLATLCVLTWLGALASQGQADPDDLTIQLDADSTEADAVRGVIRFQGVSINQGDLSVRAQDAESSSLDFADSTWTFSGQVRFASADTRVNAERAELIFRQQELVTATLSGAPLVFEQTRDGDVRLESTKAQLKFVDRALASAQFDGNPVSYSQTVGDSTTNSRANALTYDAAGGTIVLMGNAWIGEDGKEIKGNSITYNFKTRSYVAASDDGGDQRVTITITPPQNNGTQ